MTTASEPSAVQPALPRGSAGVLRNMPSNSEMYDQGVLDAEYDELNPFFYQHYYYYRKGYDDTRRQLRRGERRVPYGLLLALGLALVIGLGAIVWLVAQRGPAPVAPPALGAATALPGPAPTRAPRPSPAPTPEPATPAPVELRIGGQARIVNLNGVPLRAREAPGLTGRVVARIAEGREVQISDGPVTVDGYVWWRVVADDAAGWVAERSITSEETFLQPLP